MIQNKHIIKSLPLLATALGRKYGVEVVIGGNSACTNGKTIFLPTLPLDCSHTLLGLVRGFIDHESAHLRETDFEILRTGQLTGLEKHIWNILEDWRVEHKLAAVFPGCRQNLTWLIKHLFLNEDEPEDSGTETDALHILEWLLLTVRSWDVPELQTKCTDLANAIDLVFPGLRAKLNPILQTVPTMCETSRDCLNVAREIVRALSNYVELSEGPEEEKQKNTTDSQNSENSDQSQVIRNNPEKALQTLEKMLQSGPDERPSDIGSRLAKILEESQENRTSGITMATVGHKILIGLDDKTLAQASGATRALRVRLQALLQGHQLVRARSGYRGRLDTSRLHRAGTGDSRIFLGKSTRLRLNTAIHILLDSSGSMSGSQMDLACAACYAVATALHAVPGISLAVTAFPANPTDGDQFNTVVPILRHGQKLHNRFSLAACGSTPMDSAIWWTLQQTLFMPETRKIILIISDGEPDNFAPTVDAIQAAQGIGYEVYGIGIDCASMQRLLPENSEIIRNIHDLAPAMFGMLQKALLGKEGLK